MVLLEFLLQILEVTGVSGCSLQLIHIRVWNYFEDLQRPRRQSEDDVRVRPYVRMHCVAFPEGYWVYTSNAISHRGWRWVLLWARNRRKIAVRGYAEVSQTALRLAAITVIRESLGWWVESFGLARRTSERERCGGAVPAKFQPPCQLVVIAGLATSRFHRLQGRASKLPARIYRNTWLLSST